jgi:hypothetical protein
LAHDDEAAGGLLGLKPQAGTELHQSSRNMALIEKMAAAGEVIGLTPDDLFDMLDSGMSPAQLLDFLIALGQPEN